MCVRPVFDRPLMMMLLCSPDDPGVGPALVKRMRELHLARQLQRLHVDFIIIYLIDQVSYQDPDGPCASILKSQDGVIQPHINFTALTCWGML